MRSRALSDRLGRTSGLFVGLVYLILGMADLGFSLLAFRLGVPEGNPLLAWMGMHGLFIPAKLLLTLVAAALIVVLYPQPRARAISWTCLLLMLLVDVYHVAALTQRLHGAY